ncbi:DUF5069 domain-containing protein [Candidatus Poribacteria bacterium]|nr:DUF5069 domain-containing protein [Candidatus Poribacteria bacterium]
MPLDWKPRGRDLTIGGIHWIARITDKARAHLSETLGDYIYPCPADQAFLKQYGLSEAEFTQLVKENPTDELMVERIREIDAKRSKS